MLQLTLIWAALGLLFGASGWLASGTTRRRRVLSGRDMLARWALPPVASALAAVVGGWIATAVIGRLTATAAALGAAATVALLLSFLPPRGFSHDRADTGQATGSPADSRTD
jgi:hypothetical protein